MPGAGCQGAPGARCQVQRVPGAGAVRSVPTFKITIAYDGTGYVGWQRQAAGTSIQGLIEEAVRELEGSEVTVTGAGRTDAGVHALGQVASLSLRRAVTADVLRRAINARLPPSVRVIRAETAVSGFHARFDAKAKTYRYRVWNAEVASPFERQYAWHVAEPLDVDAMKEAARAIEGRHDFAAFQSSGSDVTDTVRHMSASHVVRPEHGTRDLVLYEVTGDGFLRHMVRAIVGTLVEVGSGRRGAASMRTLLETRDRGRAGPTAPAAGLFLVRVAYDRQLAAER